MQRINRLTAREVASAKGKRGRIADGAGLYLQDGASWVFRYERDRRERLMGLGPVDVVPLAEARELAHEVRRVLFEGKDPIAERRAREAAARTPTFEAFAERHIATHKAGWSKEHARRWARMLAKDAYPAIGELRIDKIGVEQVLGMLKPKWSERAVTADRLRNMVELVLDAAKAERLREGENPARWKGHLDKLLPAARKVAPVQHFSAMPHKEVAGLMAELKRQGGIGPAALQFLILTAARSAEVIGAQWSEFDLGERTWTLTPERTKQRRLHRVPLSGEAMEVVEAMGDSG